MLLERSNFVNNRQTIALGSNCSINLELLKNDRGLPADMTITAFDIIRTFTRFTQIESKPVSSSKLEFEPVLDFVKFGAPRPALLIVGLRDVIAVDCNDKTISIAVQLHRAEFEDQGFHWMKFLLRNDALILLYESGAMMFDNAARLKWHTRLYWDDVFLSADERYLYYSSEFGEFSPHDWVISLATGQKAKVPSG